MVDADSLWRIHVVGDVSGEIVDRAADSFDEHFPGVFGGPCDPEVFRWKLGDGNPAGRGILALALTRADVIAGVMTATMKRMVVDGQTLLGAETGDTFTHPDFRRSGGAAGTKRLPVRPPGPGTVREFHSSDPDSRLGQARWRPAGSISSAYHRGGRGRRRNGRRRRNCDTLGLRGSRAGAGHETESESNGAHLGHNATKPGHGQPSPIPPLSPASGPCVHPEVRQTAIHRRPSRTATSTIP